MGLPTAIFSKGQTRHGDQLAWPRRRSRAASRTGQRRHRRSGRLSEHHGDGVPSGRRRSRGRHVPRLQQLYGGEIQSIQRASTGYCRRRASATRRSSRRSCAGRSKIWGLSALWSRARSGSEISTIRISNRFFARRTTSALRSAFHWITGCFDSPGQERFKDPYFYIHMVGMPFNLMIGIMTLIGGGVMEKYPEIKFVFLEIGAAWLALLDVAHGRSLLPVHASSRRAYRKNPATTSGAIAALSRANPTRMGSHTPPESLARTESSSPPTIRTATATFRTRWPSFANAATSPKRPKTKFFGRTRRDSTGFPCEPYCAWLSEFGTPC